MLLIFGCDVTGGENPIRGKTVTVEFSMIEVPPGSFLLNKDGTHIDDPRVERITMTISQAFLMSETEVTQELWKDVMLGSDNCLNPSYNRGSNNTRPVENVTWFDALEFCNILSKKTGREPVYTFKGEITRVKEGFQNGSIISVASGVTEDITKNGYRLPREMEWMWAAMGADVENKGDVNTSGYQKAFAGDNDNNFINDFAWYGLDNSGTTAQGVTHGVGLKLPNELGLYDMTGNVWELCWDKRADRNSFYDYPNELDYSGPETGDYRVICGNSYSGRDIYQCAIAARSVSLCTDRETDVGFRFVRAADLPMNK